jgi:glycosyltransferase involved in cell wall biosynthesis
MRIAWQTMRRFLLGFVTRFRPDVVFAHHTAVNGFLARRLWAECGLPYVVTDHDFGEIADCGRWPARKKFFSSIADGASRMVAFSTRMEMQTKALFPGAKTCTISNGTDPIPAPLFNVPRPAALRDKIVLFSCGAFYERKGFPILAEAFARISKQFPDVVLRIAGDGPDRASLEKLVQHKDLNGRLQLLGFLPHETVLQEMCWSDAFVLIAGTSLLRRCFPKRCRLVNRLSAVTTVESTM